MVGPTPRAGDGSVPVLAEVALALKLQARSLGRLLDQALKLQPNVSAVVNVISSCLSS